MEGFGYCGRGTMVLGRSMVMGVTDAHILSYFSVFYMDLFDEVFVFLSPYH